MPAVRCPTLLNALSGTKGQLDRAYGLGKVKDWHIVRLMIPQKMMLLFSEDASYSPVTAHQYRMSPKATYTLFNTNYSKFQKMMVPPPRITNLPEEDEEGYAHGSGAEEDGDSHILGSLKIFYDRATSSSFLRRSNIVGDETRKKLQSYLVSDNHNEHLKLSIEECNAIIGAMIKQFVDVMDKRSGTESSKEISNSVQKRTMDHFGLNHYAVNPYPKLILEVSRSFCSEIKSTRDKKLLEMERLPLTMISILHTFILSSDMQLLDRDKAIEVTNSATSSVLEIIRCKLMIAAVSQIKYGVFTKSDISSLICAEDNEVLVALLSTRNMIESFDNTSTILERYWKHCEKAALHVSEFKHRPTKQINAYYQAPVDFITRALFLLLKSGSMESARILSIKAEETRLIFDKPATVGHQHPLFVGNIDRRYAIVNFWILSLTGTVDILLNAIKYNYDAYIRARKNDSSKAWSEEAADGLDIDDYLTVGDAAPLALTNFRDENISGTIALLECMEIYVKEGIYMKTVSKVGPHLNKIIKTIMAGIEDITSRNDFRSVRHPPELYLLFLDYVISFYFSVNSAMDALTAVQLAADLRALRNSMLCDEEDLEFLNSSLKRDISEEPNRIQLNYESMPFQRLASLGSCVVMRPETRLEMYKGSMRYGLVPSCQDSIDDESDDSPRNVEHLGVERNSVSDDANLIAEMDAIGPPSYQRNAEQKNHNPSYSQITRSKFGGMHDTTWANPDHFRTKRLSRAATQVVECTRRTMDFVLTDFHEHFEPSDAGYEWLLREFINYGYPSGSLYTYRIAQLSGHCTEAMNEMLPALLELIPLASFSGSHYGIKTKSDVSHFVLYIYREMVIKGQHIGEYRTVEKVRNAAILAGIDTSTLGLEEHERLLKAKEQAQDVLR